MSPLKLVNNKQQHKLFLSIDVDEWYQARWASGSSKSLFSSVQSLTNELGESVNNTVENGTSLLLDLFSENDILSTFFFTAEIAQRHPNLVKKIASLGHEVGCHNFNHIDYASKSTVRFQEDLIRTKNYLEDLISTPVIGYRAPNSSVARWMYPLLIDAGFKYDSSITPTRPMFGKFGEASRLTPRTPYKIDRENPFQQGKADFWEFPWPSSPILRLPAGSGIATRVFGEAYSRRALDHAMQKGHSTFYFHPYEYYPPAKIPLKVPIKGRLLLRKAGLPFQNFVKKLIESYKGRIVNGRQLLAEVQKEIFND